MGKNTKWSLGLRAEIFLLAEDGTWWCQAALGPAFWRITVTQCPSKPIRGGHGEENPFGVGEGVLQKLSCALPVGMSLGPGYSFMC